MTDAKLLKSWKITETLLERARNALPVALKQHEQEYVTHLARYREFVEHNEFDSGHRGPRALRAVAKALLCPQSLPAILRFAPSWPSRFARRRQSTPASKIAPGDFVDHGVMKAAVRYDVLASTHENQQVFGQPPTDDAAITRDAWGARSQELWTHPPLRRLKLPPREAWPCSIRRRLAAVF
jgi:hypothetical protein